ncbi:hypothetical protein J4422_03115 [Candidatus Pacearchaeota archaeon]|nr:hypothetical protein [Candidatus Pacearchaeota archaeon]
MTEERYVRVFDSRELGIRTPSDSYCIELVLGGYRHVMPKMTRQLQTPMLVPKEIANEIAKRWASKVGVEAKLKD